MTEESTEILPSEVELALAWCSQTVRASLRSAFQLDRRLARIVMRTTEPMLGQMRLAWWRDALVKPVAERPRGDVVLDDIGSHWSGRETALAAMIDGWEILLTAQTLEQRQAADFGMARGAFFAALAPESPIAVTRRMTAAGCRWALADAAASVSDQNERAALVAAGLATRESPTGEAVRVPGALRGLAVLDALASRALDRGGRPLMEGRGASLAALRAAIFRN